MMFFASLKMMLLHFVPRVMRCLPQCAVRHTSFAQRTSLGEANIICRRQTSFKKRTFVGRQKCVFCWRRWRDSFLPLRGVAPHKHSRPAPIRARCSLFVHSFASLPLALRAVGSLPLAVTRVQIFSFAPIKKHCLGLPTIKQVG